MAKPKKLPEEEQFAVEDRVRVKRGVTDLDYPDMPLGGWAGTVVEAHGGESYLVRWSPETLAAIHPVFKSRCEIDGCDCESYMLGGENLNPDPGGPLDIVHPTEITARPLSPRDQDDRVRIVFELTSNDPLPAVEENTLEAYRVYLSSQLVLPFRAEPEVKHRIPRKKVQVVGLPDPDRELAFDDEYGILCEARSQRETILIPLTKLDKPSRNQRLLADYRYWFWNW